MLAAGCTAVRPTKAFEPSTTRAVKTPPVVAKGPLTLDEAIRIALKNNPDVVRSRWAVRTAGAARDEAAGQRWPSLDLDASYTHSLDRQRLVQPRRPAEPGVYTNDLLDANLLVRFPIFTAGRIRSEIDAAELLRKAASRQLARTREELVFNVSSVYYAILGQRRVIESVEFSRQALNEHHKRVQDLMGQQKAARVDLLRTEVRLANVAERLVREKNRLAVQRRLLANLLGIRHVLGETPPDVAGDLELTTLKIDGATALDRALSARTDLKAARAEVESQARRVDAARAGRWPSVSLEAGYGGRFAVASTIHQGGASDGEDLGSIGAVVRFPIFEGGSIDARIRKERFRLNETRETLRKLELAIHLQVETAVLDVNANHERVAATQTAVAQAEESLRIEREKYELGKGSITDVLDAQSALLDSQTNYYRALADLDTSYAEYRFAVGESR